MLMRPKQLSEDANNQAHYFLWQFKGVKPATNVVIVPNIVASSQLLARLCNLYLSSFLQHIPQALRFNITYVRFGNLSLFASYAMLMRPKIAETAVHGCQQSGSQFFMEFKGVKPATKVAIVPNIVISSQLQARLCNLYLSSSLQPHPTSIALLPLLKWITIVWCCTELPFTLALLGPILQKTIMF